MRKQIKFQKIICLVMLIACAIGFVASLGLCTDVYEVLRPFSSETGEPAVEGANLFYNIQWFNKQQLKLMIVGILVATTLFISQTNTRRKYYISNFIAIGLTAVTAIGVSAYSIYYTMFYRSQFLHGVDWAGMQNLIETRERYAMYVADESTIFFDFSIFANLLMIIVAGLLVFNLIWKIKLMKDEKAIILRVEASK